MVKKFKYLTELTSMSGVKENLKDIFELGIREASSDKLRLKYLNAKKLSKNIKTEMGAINLVKKTIPASKKASIDIINEGIVNW